MPILLVFLILACVRPREQVLLTDLAGFAELRYGLEAEDVLDHDRLVALVFSPGDCAVALQAIDQLNAIHRNDGDAIQVMGILNTPYRQAALKAIQAYDIRFPVLYDSLGTVRSRLDASHKPALVRASAGLVDLVAVIGEGDTETYITIMNSAQAP